MENNKYRNFRETQKINGIKSPLGVMASFYEEAGHEVKSFEDMYVGKEIDKKKKRIQELNKMGDLIGEAESRELENLKESIDRLMSLKESMDGREEI